MTTNSRTILHLILHLICCSCVTFCQQLHDMKIINTYLWQQIVALSYTCWICSYYKHY